MKHVVVIAGNKRQFDDYVMHQYGKKLNYHSHANVTVFEGITFLYVTSDYQLRGYMLSSDAELVKVGTWYTLDRKTVQAIESNFGLRRMVIKA